MLLGIEDIPCVSDNTSIFLEGENVVRRTESVFYTERRQSPFVCLFTHRKIRIGLESMLLAFQVFRKFICLSIFFLVNFPITGMRFIRDTF